MRILRGFKLSIAAILSFGAVLSPLGLSFGQVATEQYGYDTLGRLSTVTYANGTTVTYVYDAAGNRKQLLTSGTGPSTD